VAVGNCFTTPSINIQSSYDPAICSGLRSSVLTTHVMDPVSRNAMTSTPFTVPTQHGVFWVCQCSNLRCPSGLIAPATIGTLHPQLNSTSLQVLSFPCMETLFYKPVGGYVSKAALQLPYACHLVLMMGILFFDVPRHCS